MAEGGEGAEEEPGSSWAAAGQQVVAYGSSGQHVALLPGRAQGGPARLEPARGIGRWRAAPQQLAGPAGGAPLPAAATGPVAEGRQGGGGPSSPGSSGSAGNQFPGSSGPGSPGPGGPGPAGWHREVAGGRPVAEAHSQVRACCMGLLAVFTCLGPAGLSQVCLPASKLPIYIEPHTVLGLLQVFTYKLFPHETSCNFPRVFICTPGILPLWPLSPSPAGAAGQCAQHDGLAALRVWRGALRGGAVEKLLGSCGAAAVPERQGHRGWPPPPRPLWLHMGGDLIEIGHSGSKRGEANGPYE